MTALTHTNTLHACTHARAYTHLLVLNDSRNLSKTVCLLLFDLLKFFDAPGADLTDLCQDVESFLPRLCAHV